MTIEFNLDGKIKVPITNKKHFTKDEILFWKTKYNKEEDLYNRGEEEQLRNIFQKKGFMSKEDFIKILEWKFQGRLIGRQKRMINLLKNCDSKTIEEISKQAFSSKDDLQRITLLSNIPAIKNSLSSVVLTFYDPENYGILDIHSWRELFGKEPKDIFSNKKRAIEFFRALREISKENNFSCREIEKALFKKNLDEGIK
jgi:hypothetical protein